MPPLFARSLGLRSAPVSSSSTPWLLACFLLALGACSGGAQEGTARRHVDAGDGDFAPSDASADNDEPDAARPSNCKTKCDPDDCGEYVADLCGGHLECQTQCPEGQVCGVMRPDKCDSVVAHCDPMPAETVCAGKCGVVSDGCSGVILCGTDNGGLSCGDGLRCDEKSDSATRNTCITAVAACTPSTCASQGIACGPAGDGCGGILDCTMEAGGCSDGKICGTGANSGKCVDPPVCVKALPAVACDNKTHCGMVSDNCGGTIDCEADVATACPSGKTCGGGGTPNVCGSGTVCTKLSETDQCAGHCGAVSDGCGGKYDCSTANGGDTCDPNLGETCTLGVCKAPVCEPETEAELCPGDNAGHKSCGEQPNGCNGKVDCGGCAADESCGRSGPSLCGPNPTCQATPVSTACKFKCGTVANGCGGTYDCDSSNGGLVCTGNEFCGALVANECGVPPSTCTPKTCTDLGHGCGLASDGCGHLINCWSGCDPADKTCNGSCGANSACLADSLGAQHCVAGAPTCTGSLCSYLPSTCSASSPTKLTGVVRTPGRTVAGNPANQLPVPNAIVYIPAEPSTPLPSVFEGVDPEDALSCGRCADEKLVADGESVLAAAVSNYRGEFTLEGRIPVDKAFKLVVKVGKWRRVVQVPAGIAQACTSQPLDTQYTRLASKTTDGLSGTHLPKVAISTGKVDEMECVFRNIGIDDTEFTVPSAAGRLHMYRANGAKMGNSVTNCTGNFSVTTNCTDNSNYGCTTAQTGCKISSKGVCSGTYKVTNVCANNSGGTDNFGCVNAKSGCKWVTTTTDISVADSTLFSSLDKLEDYDLVVWDCEGGETFEPAPAPANIEAYVDAGGRMFASHFSYTWIENNGTLDKSADWGMGGSVDSATGLVSMPTGTTARTGANAVKSPLLRDWLDWQGALTGTTAGTLTNPLVPQFPITDPRDRAGAKVGPATDEWVYRNIRFCSNSSGRACTEDTGCQVCSNSASKFCTVDTDCDTGGTCGPTPTKVCANAGTKLCTKDSDCSKSTCVVPTCKATLNPRVQQLSFNTPYGAAETEICGRVAYSGFHVANASDNSNKYFPAICEEKELSSQEKLLAFMLFNLATCVSAGDPPQPPSCTPRTAASVCPDVNDACGYVSDGCGGVVDCAGCATGFYCDGNSCKPQECTPTSCTALGFTCGEHADGCGGIARNTQGAEGCGTCSDGQVCGLGGPGLCGSAACKPIPKATACPANHCGLVSDGCGSTYDCGGCTTSGDVCGGGGANTCGPGSCSVIPKATACAALNCGLVSDGCGGTYECGTCTLPDNCGGSGHANVCGHPSCMPFTKDQACVGLECGWVSNGCGGAIQCGTCPDGGICGGAGPNLCGASCQPTTCTAEAAECGAVGDDCGGVLQCGKCPSGQTCGAAGPNKCGSGPSCTPRTCKDATAECGLIGDGCGGVLDCGVCTGVGETCGGAGVANECGTGTGGCNKLTCGKDMQCGAASDGCGGVLDCGGCASGYVCERSKCEEIIILL